MRYVLLSIIVLFTLITIPVSAQEEMREKARFLADVAISDISVAQTGREVNVTFSLMNDGGVQPGVRYGIVLMKGSGTSEVVVDEYVFDETLTLSDKEIVTRSVVYTAPRAFEGEYTLVVVSKNAEGFPFSVMRGGTVTFQNAFAALALDTGSCYLTKGTRGTRITDAVVTIGEGEVLTSHCRVTNTEPGPVTFTPWYETHTRSLFGVTVPAFGGTSESISLDANETKVIETELPKAMGDGLYAVTLGYDADGNDVTYTYMVGNTAHIENVFLDSASYNGSKPAQVSVVISGEAGMHTLAVEMRDEEGEQCGEPVFQSVDVAGMNRIDVAVPLSSRCVFPEVTVRLTDSENSKTVTYMTSVMLVAKPATNTFSPLATASGMDFGPTFFICVIALAIGLGIFYHSLYRKGKINIPKAPLVLLALVIFGFGIGADTANAASFSQGVCSVSTTMDRNVNVRTGEMITLSGWTSCPGITIVASLNNAGYGISATANSSGFFSTSFAAPATDDNLTYTSGNPGSDPFGLGNPAYPWDMVLVNRCLASMDNYCDLPGYDTLGFGVQAGFSGGVCTTSGSCNYTCQSDLTWRRNSNTCSAPPPPPPGSVPEFTSTPSCQIAANAASCTGTVNVYVPSSYAWGADLKTCSGTLLQTIPPGSHTVTVTIPYNTACFNLHPWSFFPVNPTDSVTGTSACATGTTWNNTVCAPLPPPPAPTGLTAQTWGSCGAKTIKLIWNAVAGATRYDVLRDEVTLISSVPNPYIDTVAVDGSAHTYRVRAWNASGPSAWSSQIQGTAPSACITTGSFTITSCAIQAGQSTCSATVRWTSDAITPSVLQGGSQFSTLQSSAGVPRTVNYGNNTFVLRDGPATLDTEVISIGCVSGTSWNSSTARCEVPAPPPSTRPCAGTEILGCQLDPTAHGSTDGTCNPATYTGTCSYTCTDGTWGTPSSNNCSLIPPPPPPVVTGPPVLTASSFLVRIGTPVTIRWDTNNGNESLCTLTGGTLGTSQSPIPLNTNDPNGEEGSVTQTISGRTTYTLTCSSGGSATVTIDVIPQDSET